MLGFLMIITLLILGSYVVGSIPSGYWLAKAVKGIDIREHGSKSTGATNVWRCVGKVAGTTVFCIDVGKGVVPVLVGKALESAATEAYLPFGIMPVLAALATFIGHSKSIFLGFQGGKSAATGLGTIFALNFIAGLSTFITWLSLVFLTKYVSVASMTATLLCAIYMYLLHVPWPYEAYIIFAVFYVAYRHKANIKRLMKGEEPKITDKKKVESTDSNAPPPEIQGV